MKPNWKTKPMPKAAPKGVKLSPAAAARIHSKAKQILGS